MEGNGKLLRAGYQLNTLVLQLNIQIGRERIGTVNLSHNEATVLQYSPAHHTPRGFIHI